MLTKDSNFLVVGLGLLGGSYALGLKKKGYKVKAIDIDEKAINYGIDHEIIDDGAIFNEQWLQEADVIICCLYPNLVVQWIKDNQHYFKKDAVCCDVSGIKAMIIPAIQEILRDDVDFVGCHPMAGREVKGVQFSNTDMFLPANFIITPTAKNKQRSIDMMEQLAKILQFKSIIHCSIDKHDEMIAYVSQLTHVIAVCLMNCKDDDDIVQYTGDSFRDLTRIAKINETLWTQLFCGNKEKLLIEIDHFEKELHRFKQSLLNDDIDVMHAKFIESTNRRKKFDKDESTNL